MSKNRANHTDLVDPERQDESRIGKGQGDEETIRNVVAGYYSTFPNDSVAAARFYGMPALVVLPTEVFSLPTRKDVEGFLVRGLASLRNLGYSHTKMSPFHVKRLNATTALYGTVAIRMKSDGTELERVAFTYLLHKGDAGWRIHQLIATDEDKLIA